MRIFKMIDRWLLQRWPRYRLWRICKAIGINPYKWQKRYVLNSDERLPGGRCNGKTLACMLRILMIPYNNTYAWESAGMYLLQDPSFELERLHWYSKEYRRLKRLCLNAGIPVLQVEVYRMVEAFTQIKHR